MAAMSTAAFPADIDHLTQLLLEIGQQRSVENVLKLIVERVAAQPAVALARIWLIRPGDLCAECQLRDSCPDQTNCLHLVASSGSSQQTSERWTSLNGDFRRFPIGQFKIGKIAFNGESFHVTDVDKNPEQLVRPEWARSEGICEFGGQPLIYQGALLGVLAVFTRANLGQENHKWMRIFADHAAAAISNAKAFEEIARLKEQLELERDYLRHELDEAQSFGDIIGESSSLKNVLQQIDLVAPTDASVLILGESGTGKELVAREIHARSSRKRRPLVKVNCASIPRELYESEFFGHVKGAFTGAVSDRAGRFQLADGGTLFLDEVGEIPLDMQSKLLRVLQEGELERVGEEKTRHVDVRIIAATNRDLREEIVSKQFREDLFYRLNVFPVQITPLRERKEDVAVLAAHFVSLVARNLKRPIPRLTQGNVADLERYDWPGNIRELQNVIERAVITSVAGKLRFDLPNVQFSRKTPPTPYPSESGPENILTEDDIRRIERDNILSALRRTKWKVGGAGGAAELLGVKSTTLESRIKKLGIERPV